MGAKVDMEMGYKVDLYKKVVDLMKFVQFAFKQQYLT